MNSTVNATQVGSQVATKDGKERSFRPNPVGMAMAYFMIPLLTSGVTGRLVDHFHLTRYLAAIVVNLISSGAMWEIGFVCPEVIPAEITLSMLIKVFSTTYAIGW